MPGDADYVDLAQAVSFYCALGVSELDLEQLELLRRTVGYLAADLAAEADQRAPGRHCS